MVVASVRNTETTTLEDIIPAESSKLQIVKIEATSATDATEAVEQIKAAGITTLDIVIAVAGINPSSAFAHVKDMDIKNLQEIFDVNAFAFVRLFKAVHPLLKASAEKGGSSSPKLLALSSNAAQVVDMEPTIPMKLGIYGASKATLNYLVRRTHFENPWLTCWTMNPGFVRSETGNAHAMLWGLEKAPHAFGDIIPGLVKKIDEATRAETSGNFYNFDGVPLTF